MFHFTTFAQKLIHMKYLLLLFISSLIVFISCSSPAVKEQNVEVQQEEIIEEEEPFYGEDDLDEDPGIREADSLDSVMNAKVFPGVRNSQHYFVLDTLREEGDYSPRVVGVKIYDIYTDTLYQEFELDCQYIENSIQIDSYNFDAVDDFSVFESYYSGPNTSRIYFLWNTETGGYYKSKFEGTSLEFDHDKQLVYESNSCCAGTEKTVASYQVSADSLIMIEKTCFQYVDSLQDMVKVDCE